LARRIVHWVMAEAAGKLYRVKVKDPSFANWPALSFALLKNIVPDFPLCNKSFNQSYSGNDLQRSRKALRALSKISRSPEFILDFFHPICYF
jgi:Ni,Fe-hydrogenase III large subunit